MKQTVFEAIGTHWNIQVSNTLTDEEWVQLMERIYVRIQTFDKAYSRFRANSLVTKMAKNKGKYDLPPDGQKLLRFYEQLYQSTNGKVTPLIGQTISDAGYNANYSLRSKKMQNPPAWEDALEFTSTSITLRQAALLDFGAAGKGYLVDIIAAILLKAQLEFFTINAGGDILHYSKAGRKLQVGLENPFDTTEAIGISTICNQSLCASAGSKRKWGEYHHIIDPDRLTSPVHIAAIWVIADDAMTADGIATALFFVEPEKLRKKFEFSYAMLYPDMTMSHSKDFPLTIFKDDKSAKS